MRDEHDQDLEFLFPEVLDDDVEQEYQLLKWKHPNREFSRSLIAKRLQARELLFCELVYPTSSAFSGSSDIPDYEVLERLAKWMVQQTPQIQQIVYEFLYEEKYTFDQALHLLGLKTEKKEKFGATGHASLAQLIFRQLVTPTPIEELFEMARLSHNSKRPEAAVRQTIRRLLEEDKIVQVAARIYLQKEKHNG